MPNETELNTKLVIHNNGKPLQNNVLIEEGDFDLYAIFKNGNYTEFFYSNAKNKRFKDLFSIVEESIEEYSQSLTKAQELVVKSSLATMATLSTSGAAVGTSKSKKRHGILKMMMEHK
ncbi:hypothetical protein [Oceanirhabdus sp. W0125-5]|uniref:hypothetical protein n=1 Tax=Oceanirhabdus sp. W0125-5 TaxID=2999116 RepID=UPI0022F343E0|nr:hypothetical protein [Oceanirhabdus sp. W0125-5]WBW98188.1 hypothetical protein OW730_05330 [Oceanirhabdus sp. W0125-5]